MINVVGMVYNRPEYFKEQLEYYKKQTVDFHLHIICNNPSQETFFEDTLKESGLKYTFVKSNNDTKTFVRQLYMKEYLMNTDYTIHVDDDIMLTKPTALQELWDTREPKTMKVLLGKTFKKEWTVFNKENNNASVNFESDEFSVGAFNWGIVDTQFYKDSEEQYYMERVCPELCYEADDLLMSWALNKHGYRILNHRVTPGQLKQDNKAQWMKIIGLTIRYLNVLDGMHPFKRF